MTARPRIVLFVVLALIGVGPCSLQAQATQKVFRVGILSPSQHPDVWAALRQGLRSLGYVEGTNLVIEERNAVGDYARLPALADELVKLRVDVIVTEATPGLETAEKATKAVPIVFVVGDPVKAGLVKSLARPGVNATGVAVLTTELILKQAELLSAIVPGLSRLAVLFNPDNPSHLSHFKIVQAAAPIRGTIEVVGLRARNAAEVETALKEAVRNRVGAFLWIADPFLVQQTDQIAKLAALEKLPSAGYYTPQYAEAGGLMAYGPDQLETWHQAAEYVDKILHGANAAEMPVEQPTRLHLVINKATAKALGLTIPPELLVQAERVIE